MSNIVINIYESGHGSCQCNQAVAFKFWIRNEPGQTISLIGENMLLITDTQKCSLLIQPVDSKGNPARVDGVPVWSVSDPLLLEVTAAADGLSAVVRALGPLGTGQVNVTADADLGSGTRPIAGVMDVQVEAGEAVSVNITAGIPEEQ